MMTVIGVVALVWWIASIINALSSRREEPAPSPPLCAKHNQAADYYGLCEVCWRERLAQREPPPKDEASRQWESPEWREWWQKHDERTKGEER